MISLGYIFRLSGERISTRKENLPKKTNLGRLVGKSWGNLGGKLNISEAFS
jgi:hypothetical protein